MRYTVLGVSSGLGVSLYPFREQVIANIEGRGLFHTPKDEQWKANFGDIPLIKDKFDPRYNEQHRNISRKEIDVMVSSPDCGSGSIFRLSRAKKLGDHKDNISLRLFFDRVDYFKPKFILFENLDGLFKSFDRTQFEEMLSGYRLIIHLASVSAWGNSQLTRKRLVIVGVRKDISKKVDKYFKLPDYKHKIQKCRELYENKPNLGFAGGDIAEPIDTVISIHARKRMTLHEIQQTWQKRLKGKKRWETEPGFKFSTAPGVYRNLSNDYPATARKANRQYDNNGHTLTPRDLARIQGVPDSFKLHIDLDRVQYWINKARTAVTKTPPYEIGLWFKKKLDKTKEKKLW